MRIMDDSQAANDSVRAEADSIMPPTNLEVLLCTALEGLQQRSQSAKYLYTIKSTMSLPEAPTVMPATNSTLPPVSEPEVTGSNAPVVSAAQRLDPVTTELRKARMELDEMKIRLVHARICLQSEAQSRQTLQQGLELYQRLYLNLARRYKSIFEECDHEITSLREDHQIDTELITSQRQLLDLLQSQQQQQQANNIIQGGPLLPQYNDHNHPCHNCSPYHSSGNDDFVDPTSLRPGNDFEYSMFPGEPSCDPEPVMLPPISDFENRTHDLPTQHALHPVSVDLCYHTEQVIPPPGDYFENRAHNLSVQAGLHPISAERDVPVPTHYESEEANMGPDEGEARPNKKRKTR